MSITTIVAILASITVAVSTLFFVAVALAPHLSSAWAKKVVATPQGDSSDAEPQ
ncbi:hypothetical protein [Natrialbaceae archaeon AArc-T1-2]|uniref:hypothetical protein n=1 Tax=Natrialbaceae archaeon AArc-T1-2 TaxID=3053904 RepID=UPI00255B2380|nr:hypothetical protein [Natrialbaceae archaeon AArc-T1-2]WIV65741.1 hypothetical protein QQ977_08475 [Natrialbaceae archaeon AArc-T1-2]